MEILEIVLAGGRATRMGKEKAILKVNGITLLERVLHACDNAYVAVSRRTAETKAFCISKGYPTIDTPGMGYVEDVKWLLKHYGEFLSISCDIPFIRKEDLEEIKKAFCEFSLTGFVSLKRTPKGGSASIFSGKSLVGINTVTHGSERFFEFSNELLAFNVNTPFDLFLVNRLAKLLDQSFKN
jgi:adenosylcobinamide-phosphate guanylyltransferase